jgi:hypothetical protein
LHAVECARRFAAYVHHDVFRSHCVGAEQRTFEHLVRIPFEQLPVLNVPGSDSSPFTTTYAGRSDARSPHFWAVVNALPPLRPVSPDSRTSSITSPGVMVVTAWRNAT